MILGVVTMAPAPDRNDYNLISSHALLHWFLIQEFTKGISRWRNNTQNYWDFGLRPSSGILQTRKHVSEAVSASALK
jgi:hypothetical protein